MFPTYQYKKKETTTGMETLPRAKLQRKDIQTFEQSEH